MPVKTFCSHTNLHGFSYIVQPSLHRIERIFWILSVLISFILTGILIHKLLLESQKNPTIIYTDQNVVNVEDLSFPAVTFCPGLLYKTPCRIIIDYERIKAELDSGIIKSENLTLDELKLMQIASIAARDRFMSENFPELQIPTNDFMEKLDNFNRIFFDRVSLHLGYKGSWLGQYELDVVQVLSDDGFCNTFNMPDINEIYKANAFQLNYTENNLFKFELETDRREWNKDLSLPYPYKSPKSGSGLYLRLDVKQSCSNPSRTSYYNHFSYVLSTLEKQGFTVKFHDPYEVLSKKAKTINTVPDMMMIFVITPKLSKIDESLIYSDLDDRNCYLPNEYSLDFFKVYNKVNCEHECLTLMTLNSCGCVQFFMARNQTAKICGTFDEKCFRDVEDRFDEVKSTCKCLDKCDNIKYEVELKSVEPYYEKTDAKESMYIKVQLAVDSVYAVTRKKSQTVFGLFSFIGGLLGLFAGFSVLSGAEIIYYFLIDPVMPIRSRNDSKVYPIVKKDQSENSELAKKSSSMKFCKELLENSSIHSFNQIGSDKCLTERLIWVILFTTSMILTFFMVEGIYKNYNDQLIMMNVEGNPTKVENIPFPAFTIIRDLELIYQRKYANTFTEDFKALVCSDVFLWDYDIDLYFFKNSSNLLGIMKNFTLKQTPWYETRNASWNRQTDPPFAQILTSTVYGYTFNLIKQSNLLNEEVVSDDFNYSYGNTDPNFPWSTSAGENHEFRFEANMSYEYDINYNYLIPRPEFERCTKKHAILIHSPNELPIIGDQISISMGSMHFIQITPEIVKADESLRYLDVSIRKCYFDDERKLKFFKIYTQKNCELECNSATYVDSCKCIPYNIIRNKTMQVCAQQTMRYCELKESVNCSCLPSCNYVKYSFEIQKTTFKDTQSKNNTLIVLRWKDSEYFALIRYQQVRLVDFLSYVGGILGLFAGISVLSIFELFYFLTLRLITDLIKFFRQ